MSAIKWYKRDPSAALRGMAGLNFEERGCYNTIIDLIYESADNLGDDDRLVSALAGCDIRTWKRLKARLIACGKLFLKDGKIRNVRCTAVVEECLARQSIASEAGKASAESKGFKSRQKPKQSADMFATPVATPVASAAQQGLQRIQREEKKDFLNGSGGADLSTDTEPLVTVERMEADLKRLGLKPSTKHNSNRPAFAQNPSQLPPEQRLVVFQKWLAERLISQGQLGWEIVSLALNAFEPEHSKALAICQETAKQGGKGWPTNWPTNRSPAS